MPPIIPKGLLVTFRQLKEKPGGDKLHNRYLLSDIGGIDFGAGLDDGKEGWTDDIRILGKERYKTSLAAIRR